MKNGRFALVVLGLSLSRAAVAADAAVLASLAADELNARGAGDASYDPGQRPDPFADPFAPIREERVTPGLAGMRVGEVRLQGLTLLGGDAAALLLGTDGIGYVAREGDALRDGRLVTVDFDRGAAVFQERLAGTALANRRVEKRMTP